MAIQKGLRRTAAGAVFGLLCVVLLMGVPHIIKPLGELLDDVEAKILDLRFYLNVVLGEAQPPIEDIVIVDIDSRSLNELGYYRQWPRSRHAQLIDILKGDGAAAVAFDVFFLDPDRNPEEDRTLATATRNAGNVVHAAVLTPPDTMNFLYEMKEDPFQRLSPSSSYALSADLRRLFPRERRIEGPVPPIAEAAVSLGCVNVFRDRDGVVRSTPVFVSFLDRAYAPLGVQIALGLLGVQGTSIQRIPGPKLRLTLDEGKMLDIPVDGKGRMLINYVGTYRSFRTISYYDVLERRLPPGFFEGKIVLIGASAPGLGDLMPVPVSRQFPGVEIHATTLYNILTGEFLRKVPMRTVAWIVIFLSIGAGILTMGLRPVRGAAILFVLWAVYTYLSLFTTFEHRHWLELLRPTLSLGLVYTTVMVYRYLTEEREKQRIKGYFQTYVNQALLEELMEHPELAGLGGQRKDVTIFFSDIAGFTTISETMSPEVLVPFLNEYLTAMTDIVLKHGGTVDKFEGDAVMAFFGAPFPMADHATTACRVSVEMQEQLMGLREKWAGEGHPPIHVRIGLDTGEVLVGNMGSNDKMDYTVIGDHVNLASRLEGVNKEYGTHILISDDTYKAAKEYVIARELDLIRVKGRAEPVRIYQLLAMSDRGIEDTQKEVQTLHEQALSLYRERKWTEAQQVFAHLLEVYPEDGPARTYMERCKAFAANSPPPDWDGVWVMETK